METKKKSFISKKQINREYIVKKLRIPLIFLVIVFHLISCICIGLVIAIYSFPIKEYTEEEINRFKNIGNTIVESGLNKLSYYDIQINASSDEINIGKIYTKGLKGINYEKLKIQLRMDKFSVNQENDCIYFIPNDTRKDYNYIPKYHINTGKIDYTNSYSKIRYDYILSINILLGIISFFIIVIIYAILGLFKNFKRSTI